MFCANLCILSKIRGAGFWILNAVRAFTIISLLALATACWVMIAKSGLTRKIFLFDMLALFLAFALAILLIISECSVFKAYFIDNWPVLSLGHSLAWLGAMLIFLGVNLLANLNKPAYTFDNLGAPFWRVVLSAGILVLAAGFLNIVASLVFRDSATGITARQIRDAKSLAGMTSPRPNAASARRSFSWPEKDVERADTPTQRASNNLSNGGDDRGSPILPTVQRPPTALHPINRGHYTSFYSEAHGLSRF